jgi:hypothetical protein
MWANFDDGEGRGRDNVVAFNSAGLVS